MYERLTRIQTTVDLWNGSIYGKDGALQLLLIVDYIVDWARDVFRKSILNELNAIATEDITERDSDVFSTTLRDVSDWIQDNLDHDSLSHLENSNTVQSETKIEFLSLVTSHGVVRDASIIESRLLALCLTEDDIETFLLSFPSVKKSHEAVAAILKCMKDSWCLSAETLAAMEATWTGHSRSLDASEPNETFHTKLCFSMFVTSEWQPVRQLTYLAVSESALKKLLAHSIPDSEAQLSVLHIAKSATLTKAGTEQVLHRLTGQSVIDNLAGAVSMVCLTGVLSLQKRAIDSRFLLKYSKNFYVGFQLDSTPLVIDVVTTSYDNHKIGRRLPQDQYLRFSHILSRTSLNTESAKRLRWRSFDSFHPHTNGCVLVDGLHNDDDIPQHCLYIVKGSYCANEAPGLLRKLSRQGKYYSTLPLATDCQPKDYYKYLNRLKTENSFWEAKASPGVIESWIGELECQENDFRGDASGKSSSQPILIDSSDEEPADEDADGDAVMS